MRKAIIIFLILVYQMVSTGVTIHAHYCLGYLVDVSLFLEAEKCTDQLSMPCCQDRTVSVKIEDAQQVQETPEFSLPIFLAVVRTYLPTEELEAYGSPTRLCATGESPPPDQPPFIAYQALLFYG
ncbi:MAG: hypothetical protein AAFW00_12895 [Bacteroidota bacterium]